MASFYKDRQPQIRLNKGRSKQNSKLKVAFNKYDGSTKEDRTNSRKFIRVECLNQSKAPQVSQKIWKYKVAFSIFFNNCSIDICLKALFCKIYLTSTFIFIIYAVICYKQLLFVSFISMEYGETHTSKLMQLLNENLLESNFELLKNMASQNGMPASIRNSIISITQLFEQANKQSNNYENDAFFYRDFLRNLLNEKTEFNINNRTDISSQKREQALKLLSKIKYTEKSRIDAQYQLKNTNSQLEELMRQSMIKENTEEEYKYKEKQLQSILEDRQSRINDLNSEMMTQLQQLTEKNKLLEEYRKKIKNQQSKLLDLKQRQAEKTSEILQLSLFRQKFDEIKQLFKRQEKKSKILGSQLEQKLSFIQSCILQKQEVQEKLKKTEEQNLTLKLDMDALKDQLEKSRMIKKKSTKEIFIDTNSIIQQFQMNQKVAASFQQKLNTIIGQVTSMSSLYNHSLHKGENFHRRVDNKKNILLLCKTADNRIIGGFTSNGFSLKIQQKQAKAFLFSFYDEEMKVFQLKRGKTSTTYDNDYIIFGNEELCIQKGSDQLTSYFVNGSQNILHYHCDNATDRQTFLSNNEIGTDVVKLLNYEIIELKIKIQNDQDKRA